MLNAEKHLYRLIEQMQDDATKTLPCVQHNYCLSLISGFQNLVLLLCLLLASTGQAQTYIIKTLDGTNATIKIQDRTSAPSTSTPLIISCSTDKLVLPNYWAPGEVKIIGKKFLQVRYYKRGGSGLGIGNTLLLCVSHGKLQQAMHIESYFSDIQSVRSPNHNRTVQKITDARLGIDAKSNARTIIYDSLIYELGAGINKATIKKYIVRFNQKQRVFSNYQKKINTDLTEFNRKTNLIEKRHFSGNVFAFQLNDVEYVFVGRNWYVRNSGGKDYSLVN